MEAALVVALVLSNLAWLVYSNRREEHHDTVVDVLLERIMRPDYRPLKPDDKVAPDPEEPLYDDELHLVGKIVTNGDTPPDDAA